ncbi:mitogen activated kinase-like protein [Angomonas deanei]|uniref:Protein kinase domain/Protein tyrosine kinase, putative n=1 Tax=Angomonas deanei TaxID=59799 RepID=A0A7G2BZC5_9TRYP|nr:mitogen activated kinase-like protein [Angomonas deanei]CAD2212899.1 Protein kinase domain/Protein tyrosine kinase, putative [Angomonas deanei]|eukprot:EPY33165.1 mitogen activated kinase-like protein [Angomonas deanei]
MRHRVFCWIRKPIFHNRKQINELLATVTEDEGNIVLKPKSLPPALASLSAIYRHTIIVMTDNEGKIVLFSEGAADNLGFSIRDTEGRNINTLLFGEKSFDLYTTMTDGAKKNVDMTEKVLTLAHQTLGSVSISANVVIAKDAETGEHVGFALIGSVHSDELFRTQSLFHHFFVRELLQLKIKDARYKQIIDCLQWKNLRDLSTLAKEWNSVHVRRVLSDIIKGRTDKVDVEVDPKVLELPSIICDETGMSSALSRTFELFNGKLKIRVELQRTTEAINQLVVIYLHHNNSVDKVQLKSLMHILNDMGGLLLESPGTLKLQFPFILEDDGNQALQQNRNMAVKSSGSDPLVILLLEKNALHRHNISNLVWNCGHSLRIVENVKKALQAIESSTDLSCALVDIDMKEGERVVDTLISKHIYTIETSETPGNFTKRGDALLKKPIDRDELLREFENASKLMKRMGVLGKVRNSPWTQGRMLGKGGFAAVYEATSTLTGGKMAVKVITLPNDYEDRMDDFVSEIEILCKLEHPNIIHYFYCERSDNTLYLFMALADQGTVADLLKKYPRLPESHIATLMKQLLQAVNYLHACDIIHRDIKPANMLLSHGQMKLSDFGTATTTSAEGVVGTLYYMAPEVVDGKQSGKESDIWSIGCVASECLHVARSGGLLGYGPPTNFPPDVSPELVDFIKRCTAADPNDRASAGALLLHDFIVHLENEVEDLSEVPPEAIAQYSKSKHKSEEADGSVSSAPSWSFN